MLFNLHLLRALAALSVVYFHITSEAGLNLPVNVGAHGVDVFFVISGFIIAYIGTRSPEQFLIRRMIRIVPFYWSATLVVFTASMILPGAFRSTRPDFMQLLCSLFFIPRETSYAGMFPTLVLGWSLNYEMYFYLWFSLALSISRPRAPLLCGVGIGVVVLLIDVLNVKQSTVAFYARTLVFEFVFGIAVFYAFMAAERRRRWFSDNKWFRWLLWLAAIVAVLSLGVEEFENGFGWPRFISAGIPATILVLSALLLERMYGIRTRSDMVWLLGESSYILYLIHPYVVYGVLRTIFADSPPLSDAATAVLILTLLILSAVVAVAIHLWFEKPVMAHLRRWCLRRTPPAVQVHPASRHDFASPVRPGRP